MTYQISNVDLSAVSVSIRERSDDVAIYTQSPEIMIRLLLPHKDLSSKLRNSTKPDVLIVGFKLLADEIGGGVI